MLFDTIQADEIVNKLNTIKDSNIGYVKAYKSELGGKENVSILIAISKQKKEDWANGYIENSNYARFHLYNTGKLEKFSGYIIKPFRKRTVKDIDKAIKCIIEYFN